jgi:hypothetical protein
MYALESKMPLIEEIYTSEISYSLFLNTLNIDRVQQAERTKKKKRIRDCSFCGHTKAQCCKLVFDSYKLDKKGIG